MKREVDKGGREKKERKYNKKEMIKIRIEKKRQRVKERERRQQN